MTVLRNLLKDIKFSLPEAIRSVANYVVNACICGLLKTPIFVNKLCTISIALSIQILDFININQHFNELFASRIILLLKIVRTFV